MARFVIVPHRLRDQCNARPEVVDMDVFRNDRTIIFGVVPCAERKRSSGDPIAMRLERARLTTARPHQSALHFETICALSLSDTIRRGMQYRLSVVIESGHAITHTDNHTVALLGDFALQASLDRNDYGVLADKFVRGGECRTDKSDFFGSGEEPDDGSMVDPSLLTAINDAKIAAQPARSSNCLARII